jgi:NADH-quinone oxidoreductase subunit G
VSTEELDFLAAHVAGTTPEHVSYDDLEQAPSVLLAGFEPEEESPIVFLRLHKSTRLAKTQVWSVAALASHGLDKLGGTLVPCLPGAEAEKLDSLPGAVVGALGAPGSLILLGERLASSPGALSAAAALATETGAKLVWIPRRAGERGAIDAGAVPTLLPGGRTVADAAARVEVEAVWGAPIPTQPGRDTDAILRSAADGSLTALVVGGVDPADASDPACAAEALERAGFIVSLEIRRSAVTERADVVLPVAPPVEKSGRYVTWEGRRRPFDLILSTGALSDGRVLNALAEELDVELNLPDFAAARDELIRLGTVTNRPDAPTAKAAAPTPPEKGQALLATWPELIDAGRMQDGDENLAGTAKPVRARISKKTAAEVGVVDGDQVSIRTERGVLVLPVAIDALPDRVVWLPTNARGCAVRATLGAHAGSTVTLGRPDAPPVIGLDGGGS